MRYIGGAVMQQSRCWLPLRSRVASCTVQQGSRCEERGGGRWSRWRCEECVTDAIQPARDRAGGRHLASVTPRQLPSLHILLPPLRPPKWWRTCSLATPLAIYTHPTRDRPPDTLSPSLAPWPRRLTPRRYLVVCCWDLLCRVLEISTLIPCYLIL